MKSASLERLEETFIPCEKHGLEGKSCLKQTSTVAYYIEQLHETIKTLEKSIAAASLVKPRDYLLICRNYQTLIKASEDLIENYIKLRLSFEMSDKDIVQVSHDNDEVRSISLKTIPEKINLINTAIKRYQLSLMLEQSQIIPRLKSLRDDHSAISQLEHNMQTDKHRSHFYHYYLLHKQRIQTLVAVQAEYNTLKSAASDMSLVDYYAEGIHAPLDKETFASLQFQINTQLRQSREAIKNFVRKQHIIPNIRFAFRHPHISGLLLRPLKTLIAILTQSGDKINSSTQPL